MSIVTKERLDPRIVNRMLSDDGTLATTIQVIVLAAYGPEVYEVDPLELVLRLEEDFHVKLTETIENRLKAILLATSTDLFYEDQHAFTSICNTLVNGDPALDNMEPLTIPELLWAVYEVQLSHGPQTFYPGVLNMISKVLDGEMTDSGGDSIEVDPYQYAWDFCNEFRTRLAHQLSELGVAPDLLPPIETPEMLSQSQVQ